MSAPWTLEDYREQLAKALIELKRINDTWSYVISAGVTGMEADELRLKRLNALDVVAIKASALEAYLRFRKAMDAVKQPEVAS